MGQGCVLLIEGHPLLRKVLRQVLVEAGLGVEEASYVVEGVRRALSLRPELVVVDMTMPGLDGLVLSQLIHELVPQTRILLLVDDPETYRPGINEPAVAACIAKRLAAHELPLVAHRLLETR